LAAVKNGLALKYMPEKLKTLDICMEAVKNNPEALKYVPKGLKMDIFSTMEISNSNNK
jgi:hypothetical protein